MCSCQCMRELLSESNATPTQAAPSSPLIPWIFDNPQDLLGSGSSEVSFYELERSLITTEANLCRNKVVAEKRSDCRSGL